LYRLPGVSPPQIVEAQFWDYNPATIAPWWASFFPFVLLDEVEQYLMVFGRLSFS
jgi:hypothetical protein